MTDCRHKVAHPDGNLELCAHAKGHAVDGIMPACTEPCPLGGPFPFGYYLSETDGGCFLCTDGIPMAHDEDGYKSKLELTMGVEDEDSPFRAVLKLTIDDEEEGLMYVESFPAFRCPICGKEL